MMLRSLRSFVGLYLVLQTALALGAPVRGPQFKIPAPGVIEIASAKANVPYTFDLMSLLSDPGEPPLKWFLTGQPGWLKLDEANNRLFGNPTGADAGTNTFTVTVKDKNNEGGETNRTFRVSVLAPPQVPNPLDLGIANEDKPFTFDLKTVVHDTTGGPLTFDATNLPPWLTLDKTTGILTGTPHRPDVGTAGNISITVTSPGGSTTTTASITVLKTFHPPHWLKNQFTIEDATEDKAYTRNLTEFLVNPEPVPLTFEIVSATPPPWLGIGQTSGTLFGTPRAENVGPVSVTVALKFTNDQGKPDQDVAVFSFNVIHVNHPPKWVSNPLVLPPAFTKLSYSQDLSKSASDPDKNDKLTFKIESFSGPGPNWATIDPNTGLFTGSPDKANIGDNSWVVSVTDLAGASATTTVQVKVIKSNEPPAWLAKPTILPGASEDKNYSVDLTAYAKDPDNDPMTFTLLDSDHPAWFQITSSGILLGTPAAKDVGLIKFHVRVSDNISGSDVAEVQILVAHTNHPPVWTQNPITITAKEDKPFSASIKQFAKDPDVGDTLTFSAIEGPPWAQLSPDGTFTGTPVAANVGKNQYRVRVADQGGLFADTVVIIDVQHTNHPPSWTQDPITLDPTKEGQALQASVASYAKDPDPGDTLTFSKVSGPDWITVASNGAIGGVPSRADVGLNEFKVRVMDQANADAVVTVRIEVQKVNHPPRWRQNPILMADGFEDTTYTFNLAPYATDDDGDALTFRLVSGPKWMFVGQDGSVTGVPLKEDIGTQEAVFEVSDGQATAQTKGVVRVIHKNHPPVISPTLPVFEVKERASVVINLAKPEFVSDPDGDKLNFVLEDSADWVTLSPEGLLTLRPVHRDIGDHAFRFKVDDGQIAVHGTLKIKVLEDPRPPVWLEDPIRMEAKTNEAFSGTVAGKARDLDGRPVTYSKVSGPAWLSVDPSGSLSGTPKDADLGENKFILSACNDKALCTSLVAGLLITVKPGTQVDTIAVDQPVQGAKAEYVWVVDNSNKCDKTIAALKKDIGVFYDALAQAGLTHAGVYLSADAHKWDGLPIRGDNEGILMLSSDDDIVNTFRKRTDLANSNDHCGNCYNSPIWSMFRFYERAPGLSEIFHSGFFMAGVPNDVMIVTHQTDHFKYFTKNKPAVKNFTADDFATSFLAFEGEQQQAYRINAIAPQCPTLIEGSGQPGTSAPENAYNVVVTRTNGKYYVNGCDFDMPKTLSDYAQRIVFRAYVHAKARVKLTKTPIDATTVKLTIGNVAIPGNTGAATDKWSYDAQTNEVVIKWNLIDQGQIKPGDLIRIEYRVS